MLKGASPSEDKQNYQKCRISSAHSWHAPPFSCLFDSGWNRVSACPTFNPVASDTRGWPWLGQAYRPKQALLPSSLDKQEVACRFWVFGAFWILRGKESKALRLDSKKGKRMTLWDTLVFGLLGSKVSPGTYCRPSLQEDLCFNILAVWPRGSPLTSLSHPFFIGTVEVIMLASELVGNLNKITLENPQMLVL